MSRHSSHDPMPGREDVRLHLVAEHYWPDVARYDATEADLRELHDMYHDPDRQDEAVARTRAILRMDDIEGEG